MSWETVIGLEFHAQLRCRTKLFCRCEYHYGAPANSSICPICLGLPGALPRIQEQALVQGVRAALALGARIHPRSLFARKNYFYPDLPKGYQISQHRDPLARGGSLEIELPDGDTRRIAIQRAHLEEDAGRSEHAGERTRIDFNRCGVPLLEIVTAPDLRSPAEARSAMTAVRDLLRRVGACDGDLEKGSLRCDANLSVRAEGEDGFRTRTELKNLNSFRFLEQALEQEERRQIRRYEASGQVQQETRTYDPSTGRTRVLRSKEEAQDYRYFPEPDLPPLVLQPEWIEQLRSRLPELPLDTRRRLMSDRGLPAEQAGILARDAALLCFFEEVVERHDDAPRAARWITGELLRRAHEAATPPAELGISPGALAQLLDLLGAGRISGSAAKSILVEMIRTREEPSVLVKRLGLEKLDDRDELLQLARQLVEKHADEARLYREGNHRLLGFFMGRAMQATGGKADPALLSRLLREILDRG